MTDKTYFKISSIRYFYDVCTQLKTTKDNTQKKRDSFSFWLVKSLALSSTSTMEDSKLPASPTSPSSKRRKDNSGNAAKEEVFDLISILK